MGWTIPLLVLLLLALSLRLLWLGGWAAVRGQASIQTVELRGCLARFFGSTVLLLGLTGLGVLAAPFSYGLPILTPLLAGHWHHMVAAGLLSTGGILLWQAIDQQRMSAGVVAVLLLCFGLLLLFPSDTLATVVYRLTGDARFLP